MTNGVAPQSKVSTILPGLAESASFTGPVQKFTDALVHTGPGGTGGTGTDEKFGAPCSRSVDLTFADKKQHCCLEPELGHRKVCTSTGH